MQDTIRIGLIVKPQGIRGEVKVQPLTDDINRFKNLKEVIIDGKNYRVTSSVIGGGTVFLSLFGVSDRNTAETFRGKYLNVTRENAIPLEEGRYFIIDIVGCNVFTDDGKEIGTVVDVFSSATNSDSNLYEPWNIAVKTFSLEAFLTSSSVAVSGTPRI